MLKYNDVTIFDYILPISRSKNIGTFPSIEYVITFYIELYFPILYHVKRDRCGLPLIVHFILYYIVPHIPVILQYIILIKSIFD